jgi:sugar (pentulose or hexulose) kinase
MDIKRLFAADLGASGGKCFTGTFENGSFRIEELHRFTHEGISLHVSSGDGEVTERTFWDDLLIYQNIIKGLNLFRREVSEKLDSIGIDTWGSDGQFITRDGDFLGKIYCYRDHRLDNMIEKVIEKISPERIYEITGIHFQPFNLSNQFLWFMLNRSYLLQPGCCFLPMPTVFYNYLGNVKKIDSTWASVSQLMDAKKKDWSREVLDKLGIPAGVMPEIVPPGTVLGRLLEPVADSVRLNRANLVAVCSHDTASAYAAAPVINTDEAMIISSGTWSIVGKLVPAPITSAPARSANISNEGGIGNIRLIINCMGTWIVQEMRRLWRSRDGKEIEWGEITRLVGSAPPFTAFIDPDDKTFYNPADMEEAVALYCNRTGQQVPKTRAVFLRVVFESLAMKYRMVKEKLTNICGKPTKVVHIVGGGSKNTVLNQFTADATGLFVLAGPSEATAVGNIMVQAVGLGILSGLDEASELTKSAFRINEYMPKKQKEWNSEYKRFLKIVSA